MNQEIPCVVEMLHGQWVVEANPKLWPDYLQNDPMKGYSLYSFYRGLRLGLQIADACLDIV